MRLFDTIDEMKSWFKDVNCPIEITHRLEACLPWRVRIGLNSKLYERPFGEGESISDAFELAIEQFDQSVIDTSRQRRPIKEYLDVSEPVDGLFANSVDELERWFGVFYHHAQFTYRVLCHPRWCVRTKQDYVVISKYGDTLDEAASKLYLAVHD